ncbi:PilT domain-containing protein [Bartonella australis AUST/NH1]|uniref:PilT domain-containing protein n=2 Tax=Bartonella australis TaxID=388640 RepID=M1PE06_BARAA|nr:PilT domain-containing protein [Bartonella australis AUST/NH1]
MFVDASAIIAVINEEPEAAFFNEKLKLAKEKYSSSIAKFEAVAGLCVFNTPKGKPISQTTLKESRLAVHEFFMAHKISLIPVSEDEGEKALDAKQKFGKGTGQKAQLNMGDCFAYACAVNHKLPLLFKGNDFIHTDIDKA